MAEMPYEFHPDAQTEVEGTGDWYAKRDLIVADRFYQELHEAIRLICELSETWPAYLHSTQRYLLNDFPFSLIYRNQFDAIQIIALAHHRRKPGYWSKRVEEN